MIAGRGAVDHVHGHAAVVVVVLASERQRGVQPGFVAEPAAVDRGEQGVDVPAVDMVAFVAPRRSKIDIVQATGRAMRKAGPEKNFGYILMPLFLEQEEGETLEDALERSQFEEVAAVLNAMQEQDEDLAEIIREMKIEKGRVGGYDESRLTNKLVMIGPQIDLVELKRAISAVSKSRSKIK